jgi:hypothetical protein
LIGRSTIKCFWHRDCHGGFRILLFSKENAAKPWLDDVIWLRGQDLNL